MENTNVYPIRLNCYTHCNMYLQLLLKCRCLIFLEVLLGECCPASDNFMYSWDFISVFIICIVVCDVLVTDGWFSPNVLLCLLLFRFFRFHCSVWCRFWWAEWPFLVRPSFKWSGEWNFSFMCWPKKFCVHVRKFTILVNVNCCVV